MAAAALCSQCVFKMNVLIPKPSKCEVRAVVQFLSVKGGTTVETHHQLVSVYGKDVMNRQNVAKWCHEFEVGRSDVHDGIRSGRSSDVTGEIIQKTAENIHADRCLSINELHQQCPEVSTVLHEIVTKRLGYHKLHTLGDHKKNQKNRMDVPYAFLACYENQGKDFLDCIVMGNKTWVYHKHENKRHSMQW
jgi:hypothetical protein